MTTLLSFSNNWLISLVLQYKQNFSSVINVLKLN